MIKRLLRQPILWFLCIGGFLFAVDGIFSTDQNEILISSSLNERLATLWKTQTGEIASEQELRSLVKNWIHDEVLYQEALRLGLDQEDSIVRRRLIQKISFIAESEPLEQATDSDLRAWYDQHIAEYTLPRRYSFSQLYFSSFDSATQAAQRIEQGEDAENQGETSMLNSTYSYRSALDLSSVFGRGFADSLDALEIGGWRGPVKSGYAYHLIKLAAIHPPQATPYDAIQLQVSEDYKQQQKAAVRDSYIDEIIGRYTIIREPK